MKRIGLLVALAVLLGLPACFILAPTHDDLRLEQVDHTGSLQIDGIYLQVTPGPSPWRRVFVLYSNGVVRSLGSYSSLEEARAGAHEAQPNDPDRRYNWGLFLAQGDSIVLDRWAPGDGVHTPAFRLSGPILNDTSFAFNLTEDLGDGDVSPRRYEEYTLIRTTAKPDSTNSYL